MKSLFVKLISYILISAVTFSCSEDNNNGDPEIGETDKLVGTKWVLKNWDYSLGEDYIGLHDETYNFFFYSQTEGVFYYGKKDNYSDQGSSNMRVACHFNYEVNGEEILLEYITDKFLNTTRLKLNGDILFADQLEFEKENISYTDNQWLNTIHGTSGSCFWYSDMNGKLWIIGDGAMANYASYQTTPWAKNNRTPNKVIVDEGVTTIGSYAFATPSITDVEMPDRSLKQVGDGAFKGSLIKTIWMSQNTTMIGKEAFADCKYLKDISIPENIETIGEYAFARCAINVFKLEFGINLRSIGSYAFEGGNASYLTFEEGVQKISAGAFLGNYCGISKELILPNSLVSIGANVFEGTYKKIVIGAGITEIGEAAFISGATSGEMYVNLSTPPSVGDNIIVERTNWSSAESRWILYVPKGCKSAYSNKYPWNKFKSIVEDSSLTGGNSNSGSSNGGSKDDKNGNINGHEYVDLGLPSGLKWATCNIGAFSPEESGDYFAWGETTTKSEYIEENCKTYEKNIADINGSRIYDAATANWGGSWRMPTEAEFEELMDNCIWTWITQGGHYGYKVTSMNNGEFIFLPASGSKLEKYIDDIDTNGRYWSSNSNTDYKHSAYSLTFTENNISIAHLVRYAGFSVRPVSD